MCAYANASGWVEIKSKINESTTRPVLVRGRTNRTERAWRSVMLVCHNPVAKGFERPEAIAGESECLRSSVTAWDNMGATVRPASDSEANGAMQEHTRMD